MTELFKKLLDQPYWIVALILGCLLVLAPVVTVDKDYHWQTHSPNTYIPTAIGAIVILVSIGEFGFSLRHDYLNSGLNFAKVKEENGVLSTSVSGCVIRVVNGDIIEHAQSPETTIVLPCNEYFDDECVSQEARSAHTYREFLKGSRRSLSRLRRPNALRSWDREPINKRLRLTRTLQRVVVPGAVFYY